MLLMLFGCKASSSTPESLDTINTTDNASNSDKLKTDECPSTPSGEITNPEKIDLEGQTVNISDRIKAGQDIGYTFLGKENQKLNYSASEHLCIWVFTQENKLVDGVELPQDGTYFIHTATPKGTTTFELELSLDTPLASSPSSRSSSPSSTSSSASSGLTQEQAVELINRWLSAKSDIFAPPFNRSLVDRYTTGTLHNDITKPNGSIDWLRNNSSRYSYKDSRVLESLSFSDLGNRPELTVKIYENRTLYSSNRIDYANSGELTDSFTYFFVKEDGTWKIEDYKEAN